MIMAKKKSLGYSQHNAKKCLERLHPVKLGVIYRVTDSALALLSKQ